MKYKRSTQRWFSGRILACHAGGPGSIPGRCIFLIDFLCNLTVFISTHLYKYSLIRHAIAVPFFKHSDDGFTTRVSLIKQLLKLVDNQHL